MAFTELVPGSNNLDLERERAQCSFTIEEFALWWYGGAEKLRLKRERERILADPVMRDETPTIFLSHKERYEVATRKAVHIMTHIRKMNREEPLKNFREDYVNRLMEYYGVYGGMLGAGSLTDGNPMAVHFGMFLPTIIGQGTIEQQEKWIHRAWNIEFLGTYAQTELGHGTFLRGLQTTATFDVERQEFVLNSPTISSYKWWPGGLGHTSNYAVVIAQLYSLGVNHGIQTFMVQLRDSDTHHPMPGITIGDIGPKMGLHSVNNGFLAFDNVRVPRDAMLMGNARINEDGSFVKSPASVLGYGTMVFVRSGLARDMVFFLTKAATIATRYSAVRLQSPIDPARPEPQIMDHVTQQNKLFPNIARAVAFKFVADRIWQLYLEITSEIKAGNLERMAEIHALSSGIKAVTTLDTTWGIEQLRMACGGHGYMESSQLHSLYGYTTAAVTYDGEQTVMLLQTSRFLIKHWELILKNPNAKLPNSVEFFRTALNENMPPVTWDPSLKGIVACFQSVAANKLRIANEHLQSRLKAGAVREVATNQTSIELAQAADAFCRAYFLATAVDLSNSIGQTVSGALSSVILQLVELYAVEQSQRFMADLIRFTGIAESDILNLQSRLENLLHKIRPNAVGIVDGFDYPDYVLCSTLGAYDGRVYERIFAEAKKSPLNKEPVNKSFHTVIRPCIKPKL